MKINFNYFTPKINENKRQSNVKTGSSLEYTPTKDEFIKSNNSPSFGMANKNENDIFGILSEIFDSCLSSYASVINKITSHIDYLACETDMKILFQALEKNRNLIKHPQNRAYKIKSFIYGIEGFTNPELTAETLNNAGITLLGQMPVFLNIYNDAVKNYPNFKNKSMEAVEIYGRLNNKKDLSLYPEMLLFLYNRSEEEEYKDKDDINSYPSFLKSIGIESEKEFKKEYSHIKESFNGFESSGDLIDAIDYVKETYPDKIRLIDEIISSDPEFKGLDSKKVYMYARDIIDYLYEKSSKESLLNFKDIIKTAIAQNKISDKTKEQLKNLVDFSDIEDKIDFFATISECGINPDELNKLTRPSIAKDVNLIDTIIDKPEIISGIRQAKNCSKEEAESFYSKYKELLYIGYLTDINNEEPIANGIFTAINFIEKTKLSSDAAFMQKYTLLTETGSKKTKNKKQEKKQEKPAAKEIRNFMDLFLFADEKEISKAQIRELEVEKEEFELIRYDIEKFLKQTENIYLIGLSPFEIYRRYKDLITKNPDNTGDILNRINTFDIKDESDYKQKEAEFRKISGYFPNKKAAADFVLNNEIKLDGSEESKEQRALCLRFLDALNKEPDIKERKNYFEKLSASSFLKNQKANWGNFLAAWGDKINLCDLTGIILDMNIQSPKGLDNILKKYKDKNGEAGNIISHLKKYSSLADLNEYRERLLKLKELLKKRGIEIPIDNSNIKSAQLELFGGDKPIGHIEFLVLIQKLTNSQEGNFLYGLNETFKNEPSKYSKYGIAEEIAKVTYKSPGSYQKLLSFLNVAPEVFKLGEKFDYEEYASLMAKRIPDEFAEFINSNVWSLNSNKIPNLDIHAKLRIIERFVLNKNIDLYSDKSKELIRDLFNTIYKTNPYTIKSDSKQPGKRFIAQYNHGEQQSIKAAFTSKGQLITVIMED